MNQSRDPYGQDPTASDNMEYSATALASHWIQRPEPETVTQRVPVVRPDRVEGVVLRFGPGVTAAALRRCGTTMPGSTAPGWTVVLPAPVSDGQHGPRRPRRGTVAGRWALPAVVLLCVLAFLGWQRYGPTVAVRDVAVQSRPENPGCHSTVEVVGIVDTDGRPGTLTYRWVRSDGSTSGVLREKVRGGQSQAQLRLLWKFSGEGEYRARAELEILSPGRHRAATTFTYVC